MYVCICVVLWLLFCSQVLMALSTNLGKSLQTFAASSNLDSKTRVCVGVLHNCGWEWCGWKAACFCFCSSSLNSSFSFFLVFSQQPGLLEFIQPLLNVEQLASKCRQWRLHRNFLEEFSFLNFCMTSDQLYNKFVPVCWKYVGKSVRLSFFVFMCVCVCVCVRVCVCVCCVLSSDWLSPHLTLPKATCTLYTVH